MVNVLEYADVYAELEAIPSRYLVLGNGFSIALKPEIFTYKSLYEHAALDDHPHIRVLFERLNTSDFELVIKNLISASRTIEAYEGHPTDLSRRLRADAEVLKGILVNAIAGRHPDRPYDIDPAQYEACRAFLATFRHIYTLNYDVILYWTLMQDEVDGLDLRPDDGFRNPEEDEPFVTWQEAHSPTIHYIHGALHLFDDAHQIIKFTWSKTDVPIVEQIRLALATERYPIFVAEGSSNSKMERILHNAYLHKALRSLEGCANVRKSAIVVFGHSLADNDDHVLKALSDGKTAKLFVSLFGDQNTPDNQAIIQRAYALAARRAEKYPLDVRFFDAESAHVWG